jgi:hypothetical protein
MTGSYFGNFCEKYKSLQIVYFVPIAKRFEVPKQLVRFGHRATEALGYGTSTIWNLFQALAALDVWVQALEGTSGFLGSRSICDWAHSRHPQICIPHER